MPQPAHASKTEVAVVGGAVTAVPVFYVNATPEVTFVLPLLSAGLAVMLTPVVGSTVATVSE